MVSPSAENIETAVDQLKGLTGNWILDSQRKELHSACGDESDDFARGYELGLQTARVVIAGSVAINMANVKADDVL